MTPELDWLKRWAQYAPTSTALMSGETGRVLSYAQVYAQALRLAEVLSSRFSVQRGDRVACVAGNELEYVSLFFALQRLGAILVPVNFRFTAAEVAHIVRDSGAKLVIAEKEFRPSVRDLSSETQLWNFNGEESLLEIAERGELKARDFVGEWEDPVMILYTSGTTGFPKGAVISHRMIFWNSINTGLRLNLTQSESVLTFLPLFHTGGWNVLTTPCLHRGAKVVVLKKFDADLILRLSESEKVTVLFGVPTTMDFLSRSPIFASADLRSIRYAVVGGEPMPLPLIDVWEKRGIPVRQGYGLTEFGPNVFSLNEQDSRRKMGSIGFPNFYIEAKVVDDQGREVAANEVGELVLKGPMAMSGYWKNPKATEEVFRDGWLKTGDLVRKDEEGYFFVVGRKKEMFISGGENVYPAEVEKVLRQFTGVREAAVIGVPHPRWGESGKAFVSFESGIDLAVENLREHCLKNLAKFKVPFEFVVMKDLPKTESGKIAKKQLH
jgi:fatty-acyl-CoA synthase